MTQRVVVTGLGAVTPVGNNVTDTWNNLLDGKSGIRTITLFDASELDTRFGGEIKDFDPIALFGRKDARRMDRFTQFSMEASRQSIEDAGLAEANIDKTRVGTVIGSGLGGMITFLQQYDLLKKRDPRRISPFFIPMILPDTAAARLAIEYGYQGPSMSVASACASGTNAVGEAFEMVARGAAEVMVVGGALEALVCAKTLQSGLIPPTINYESPDPECDLDYTPNTARQINPKVAMSNSFGFGGHNATVILKKYD